MGATWRQEFIVSEASQSSRQQEDNARMKLEAMIPKNDYQREAYNCVFGYLQSALYSE